MSFKCDLCDYVTNYKSSIKTHKRYRHDIDLQWYSCDQEGCNFKSKYKSSIKKHKSYKHDIDVKWYYCFEPNCSYKTKCSSRIKPHKRDKHGIDTIWYHCSEPNCDYKNKNKHNMTVHKSLVHDINVQWHYCDQEGCDYKCKLDTHLKRHKSYIHDIDVQWHYCDFPMCDYKSKQKGNLTVHRKCVHDPKRQLYRKKEEEKISKLLREHDIKFEREVYIKFDCFDSGKNYAYVDFVIYRKDCTILLEVDEYQHKYGRESVNCDMKRMVHIITSIKCSGNNTPVLFLRYNPNSYKVDQKLRRVKQEDKQAMLIKFLRSYCVSEKELEIKYMNYDEENGLPCVIYDKHFSLKDCVI